MSDIYTQLSEPFSAEAERTLVKSGTSLTYIPQAEVVARLNRVFGVHNWSSETLSIFRDATDKDWVVAHVRITASITSGDRVHTISHDGVGGQKIKRTKAGDPVDLGDEFKGAASDALKKAATLFGVGLYLSRDSEAMEVEDLVAAQAAPVIDETVKNGWDALMSMAASFNPDQKKKIKDLWVSRRGEETKMTASNCTVDDIEALCGLAAEFSLSGMLA